VESQGGGNNRAGNQRSTGKGVLWAEGLEVHHLWFSEEEIEGRREETFKSVFPQRQERKTGGGFRRERTTRERALVSASGRQPGKSKVEILISSEKTEEAGKILATCTFVPGEKKPAAGGKTQQSH